MNADPRWHVATGLPWRVTRSGVVVAVPTGTLVASGLAAEVLVRLPATTSELAADLAGVPAADLTAALEHLATSEVLVASGA